MHHLLISHGVAASLIPTCRESVSQIVVRHDKTTGGGCETIASQSPSLYKVVSMKPVYLEEVYEHDDVVIKRLMYEYETPNSSYRMTKLSVTPVGLEPTIS